MPPRAIWKGYLKIAELTCQVSLYTAVSASERIAFHTLNRATGHRVSRQFIDPDTDKPVPREDQVKGYAIGSGDYIVLEPEEIAAALPDSDKALVADTFVPCRDIDEVYLDRPYFVAPSDAVAGKAYALICEALISSKVAALATTVLFRRVRTVLVRAHDGGLVANLLNFDYEVRSQAEAFEAVPDLSIKDEMLKLAEHIISTKRGTFDPKAFDDRYENAVAEMVKAKLEGRPLAAKPAPKTSNVVDLLAALRESAKMSDAEPSKKGRTPKTAKPTVSSSKAKGEKVAMAGPPRRKAS